MADRKITELANITGANLADADEFVVVDASADETKAITFAELKSGLDTATGFVRITGDTMTGDLNFGDNNKAIFGAGSDLQIFHDGSHSYIKDVGTGNFELSSNGDGFYFRDGSSNYLLTLSNGGSAQLYHNGSAKLATTSTGVDITGTLTSDGLTVDKTATISTTDYYGASTFSSTLKGAATNTKAALLLNSVSSSGQNAFASIHSEPIADFRASLIGTYSADGSGAGYFSIKQFLPTSSTTLERMRIDQNGDISFYEDTGTTAKFFWDASAESLGIGTSSPNNKLSLVDATGSCVVDMAGSNGSGSYGYATISTVLGSSGNGYGDLTIGTSSAGTVSERMRIDSSGNLLCGSDGGGDIGSDSKRFKDLYLSGGVYLGGTGSANKLDDYEEGTWTPAIYGNVTAGTFAPASESGGFYIKIGRQVTCWFNANGTLSGAAGGMQVSGLPFTVASNVTANGNNAVYSSGSIQYWDGAAAQVIGPLTPPSTTYMYFHTYATNSSKGGNPAVVNGFQNVHAFVTYYTG